MPDPLGPKMLAVASKNPKQKIVALNLSCVCLGDRSQAVGDVGEFQSGGWGQIARKLAGDPCKKYRQNFLPLMQVVIINPKRSRFQAYHACRVAF